MLTTFQALVLGLLQGVTELFPISSLGHSVILPSLLGWQIDQSNPDFVAFIVFTHLATALVLFVFFFAEWRQIIGGIFRSIALRQIRAEDTFARIGWLMIVSSIPAGLLGLFFETTLSALFAVPLFAGFFLIGNGLLLYGAEWLQRRRPTYEAHDYARVAKTLTWADAAKIGLVQCLALLPGFSRTGATLAGGLLSGLSHEDAARYAFLLATPIIFAAALLKLPELGLSGAGVPVGSFAVGALAAAVAAYFSVRFLTRYFSTRTLTPFALYCVLVGGLTVLVLS